jgi:antibiotic biosynthesis monooxygenase (ABM) superfamily enzyme
MAAGAQTGAKPFAAAAACVFFAPHPGYFEAVWKPAYIFDILCATFCLLSLLSYVRGRWIVSFLCFWLAYKGKELAVMLPFVLAAYEHCF